MSRQPRDTQQQQLIATVKRLTRSVERLAATIQSLNARLDSQDRRAASVTETHQLSNPIQQSTLNDQPIILDDNNTVTIVVDSVHGVRDILKFPKQQ